MIKLLISTTALALVAGCSQPPEPLCDRDAQEWNKFDTQEDVCVDPIPMVVAVITPTPDDEPGPPMGGPYPDDDPEPETPDPEPETPEPETPEPESKGNNGHGNDPDGNDSSNPGKSNNGDGTDADGRNPGSV